MWAAWLSTNRRSQLCVCAPCGWLLSVRWGRTLSFSGTQLIFGPARLLAFHSLLRALYLFMLVFFFLDPRGATVF